MHKCIRNINIYVIYSPTDTLRSNGILSFRTFSISYNSDRNLYYNLYRVATFKAYIQGVRLKSDVMHKLFESNGGGHCYEERRNSFLFRGERTTFVERNEIFYHHREMGLATRDTGEGGGRERQRISYYTYDIERGPCLLNFKSRQSNYGGCSLNRAICSSRLNPHC